jgi:TolB protein
MKTPPIAPPTSLLRRSLIALPLAGLAAPAWSQFRVEISGVGATQLPIAVARFRAEDAAPQPVSAIVRADLERSGLFRGVDAAGNLLDETAAPSMSEWRGRNADALLAGSVMKLADGRFDVRYRLWDVVKGADLGGQSYAVEANDLRLAAHRIADAVYERLTGEKGVFSTRLAHVTKAGPRYTLWVTDADGEGGQSALASPEPIISPAWSPDGRELAYVSFETRKAVVYVQEVASGKRRAVAAFKGSNSAPAWSPDGRQLALTLSRDGGSQLYLMERDGSGVKRFTQSSAIDTEAAWSPDGKQIYFVSDRGGGPQIYRQPVAGGNAERLSFNGSYNISPAPSPDGRLLAFVTRDGGAFRLQVMDLADGKVRAVGETRDDESPSFSPNSRLIIYATRDAGRDALMTTTADGRIKARLVSTLADVREPAWGPYGR